MDPDELTPDKLEMARSLYRKAIKEGDHQLADALKMWAHSRGVSIEPPAPQVKE